MEGGLGGGSEDQLSTCSSSLELEDIQEAILGVQRTILETDEETVARRELVHRLIRLRLRKEELENRQYFLQPGQVESAGHTLLPADTSLLATARPAFCQQCGGGAWPLVQAVFTCRTCGHTVHAGCLESLRRPCVGAFLTRLPGQEEEGEEQTQYDGRLSLTICPELSLAEQNYACAECQALLQAGGGRLCDYTGLSYCPSCHWAAVSPSPARILANWDFQPRPMAQASLQYLSLMARKPLLHLAQAAPGLAAVIEEVSTVATQRSQLMSMKKYLVVCRMAQEERLLTHLKDRQHFVEGPDMYSLQDLVDLEGGQLTSYLSSVLDIFREHIQTCVLCMAKSFVCEVCVNTDTLFPFSPLVEVCGECEAVLHRECARAATSCPRCERKKWLKEKKSSVCED